MTIYSGIVKMQSDDEYSCGQPQAPRAARPTGFFYLATPYTLYPGGIEAAFDMACLAAARFIMAGVPVFSPIAHSHPVARRGGLDPLDHSLWLAIDRSMMNGACGLIVWQEISWERSYGVRKEIEHFNLQKKPVFHVDPNDFPIEHFLAEASSFGWTFPGQEGRQT